MTGGGYCIQYSAARLIYIHVRSLKITGVPWVGDIYPVAIHYLPIYHSAIHPLHHQRHFVIGVVADDTCQPSEVRLIGADDMVVVRVVRTCDLTRGMRSERHALLAQLALGRWVDVVADLFGRYCGGSYLKLLIYSGLTA